MKTPLLKDYKSEFESGNSKKEVNLDDINQIQLQHQQQIQQSRNLTNSNKKLTSTYCVKKESVSSAANVNNSPISTYYLSNCDSLATDTIRSLNSSQINRMVREENELKSIGCTNAQVGQIFNASCSPQSIQSASTSLNGTNSSILCRICYGSDCREQLLQPCNCSGTMGLMHRSCLERWLSQSNSTRCEICKFDFSNCIHKVPKSFSQWLFRPLSTKDNKNLFNDFVCFLILTPLACISTWYCVLFAVKFHEAENRWEASGLVVLTSFLLFIYILWFIFSCKYHMKVFKDWQKKNQIVTLRISMATKSKRAGERKIKTKRSTNCSKQIQYKKDALIQLETSQQQTLAAGIQDVNESNQVVSVVVIDAGSSIDTSANKNVLATNATIVDNYIDTPIEIGNAFENNYTCNSNSNQTQVQKEFV